MPLVRLFVPSEEDESTLLNLAELIGIETEREKESQEEPSSAGYVPCSWKIQQILF